jgi:uncharacterized membrane protein
MAKTVTRSFDHFEDAQAAADALERLGIKRDDISIVASDADGRHRSDHTDGPGGEAVKGAEGGAAVGGAVGLAAGLGLLAIPGIGPVVAAGWLASTLAGLVTGAAVGGATGGLVGALTHHGVSEADAHVYSESVRRGGSLVSARVADDQAVQAEAILDERSGVTATTRAAVYRADGWSAPAVDMPGDRVAGEDRMAQVDRG